MNKRRNWTRNEVILAFELYCTIPSSKVTANHEAIVALANLIGRTPNAVKLKMQNFKTYDPSYTSDGRVGLSHGSKLDKEIVEEFAENWDEMVIEAENIKESLGVKSKIGTTKKIPQGYDKVRLVKTRVGQSFFRDSVLSAYDSRCCVTGIELPELLIASHIKPWLASSDSGEKTNPQNGLCLNAFHDSAFDKGFFTITADYKILVSREIIKSENEVLSDWLNSYNGKSIIMPNRFTPRKDFIEYHNDLVFRK